MAEKITTREKTQMGNASSRAPETLVATIPCNLPRSLTRPIGREREIQAVREFLLREDVSLVTLTGLGGAGKTTLALYMAASLLEEFSGGVFFVNLAALTDGNLILAAVAETLNMPEEPGRSLLDSLHDFLVGRPILLVLDNLEQLLDGVSQVNNLLQAGPLLKILATSREALRLRGEQVLGLSSLSDEFALELFLQRARAIDPDYNILGDDRDAVLQICRKLDGLPLAIELAAQRTKLFSARSLLQRLQADLGADSPILSLLTSGARDLPARQRTLRDTIAWSYSLLNESEQRLFRVAALFPAGVGIDSLARVAAVPEMDAMEQVASLVDKSLLRALDGASPYFVMLETLREFAREESMRVGGYERDAESFVAFYTGFASQASAGLKGGEQGDWFLRLQAEHPNLMAALELSLRSEAGSQNWKSAFAILDDLHRYWMLRGYFHHGEQWIERGRLALEQYEATLPKNEARTSEILYLKAGAFGLSGSMAWARGRYSKGADWHQAAFDIYESLGDDAGMAETLNNLAVNQIALGQYSLAIANHRKGIDINRTLGDRWSEMRQLNNLGACLMNVNQMDEACECFERGLVIGQELDDQYFVSVFLYNMADSAVKVKQFEKARQLLHRSMTISDSMGIVYLQAWSRMLLAQVELGQSRPDSAALVLRQSILLSDEIADADLHRLMLWEMVSLCVEVGKIPAAATLLECLDEYIRSSRVSPTSFETDQTVHNRGRIESRLTSEQMRLTRERGQGMSIQTAFNFWQEQTRDLWEKGSSIPAKSLLTGRELEVLKLLAAGKTNEQISRELIVVLKTVEKHIAGVLRKLGVRNRTEAAAWAIAQGLAEHGSRE